MGKFIVTTSQLADIFGVTDRAIQLWAKEKSCPRVSPGKWNLREVLNWWLENIYRADDDDEEMAQAKREYWQAKARTEKVKADLADESSMKVQDFKDAWTWRVSEMSNGLGAIPLRLSPLLIEKSEKEVKSILENEIWKIRDKFARTGKFTPAPKKKPVKKPAKKSKKAGRK